MRTAFWLVIVALAFGLGVGAGALILPADSKPPTTIGDSSEAAEQPNKPQTALPADQIEERLRYMLALLFLSPSFHWR